MNKQLLVMGMGAGTGALVPIILQKYVDPQHPGFFGMKLSTIIPIATGVIGLGVTLFTNLIKNNSLKDFIIMYSFPAIFAGVMNQVTESLGFRGMGLRQQAPNGRYMQVRNPYYVTSKVPGYEGTGLGRQIPNIIIA